MTASGAALRITLVTPTERCRKGNWVTAERWSRILRQLGHRPTIGRQLDTGDPAAADPDVLVALHARKSFPAIADFHRRHPERPLLVALTGTDLYRDLASSAEARQALNWADRLIVLQALAGRRLAPELAAKVRLIRQSATVTRSRVEPARRWFEACVIGHLRAVKDPFRAAEAARLVPPASRLRVVHLGAALDADMARRARREQAENRRYRWLGDRPRWQVRRWLRRARLMVLSSTMEGGANVVSEALIAGTPILASRIDGTVGMLGGEHPGLFEVGDTARLAALLWRCEHDAELLQELAEHSHRLAPLYQPAREQAAWRALLAELGPDRRNAGS